jgi:hypothetical protein
MSTSAEIRWFWPTTAPAGLEHWFHSTESHPYPPGGGGTREDTYLDDPSQTALGLKYRGGKKGVEIKGLVEVRPDALAEGPFEGPIELWAKWTAGALVLDTLATIGTEKRRWLRKFAGEGPMPEEVPLDKEEQPLDGGSLPERGCNVELTRVTVNLSVWWTFGLEAFGTLRTVEGELRVTARLLSSRQPPDLRTGILASYPAWLSGHAREAHPTSKA